MWNTLTISSAPWAFLIEMSMGDNRRGLPGESDTYGNVDEEGNYYVGIAEGYRDGRIVASRDINYGAFYGERLFIWGQNDNHDALPQAKLLEYLKEINYHKSDGSFWDKCNVWRGYSGGKPTFHKALRAESNIGATWYDMSRFIEGNLPDNWHYDFIAGGPQTATINIELPNGTTK